MTQQQSQSRRRKKNALRRAAHGVALVVMMLATQACPTTTVYRGPARAPAPSAQLPPPSYPPPDYPPAPQPPARGPIYEEDLRDRSRPPESRTQREELARPLPPPSPAPAPAAPPPSAPVVPAPLPEETSLLAKITPATSPQRAASIRVTEEGKKLLESGDHARALSRLERTIAIDSTNPYGYYFLAKAHASLGRHQESLRFLDIAESLLSSEPYWLAEVFALRGENYRNLGALDRASSSYSQALRLNPGNRSAADGLGRIQDDAQPGSR